MTIERAFSPGADAAATCLALCRAASDTPLVGVEFDADCENLRMVIETVVEDGGVTRLQLLSMVDSLVEAAEAWQSAVQIAVHESSGMAAGKPRIHARRKVA